MSVLHERWRRRVSLLASGVLEADEVPATLAHVEQCASCAAERSALTRTLALVAQDPLRTETLPISLAALRMRVDARLVARGKPVAAAPLGRHWLAPLAAAASVVLALLALPHASDRTRETTVTQAPPMLPDDMLRRMEGQMARDQAARYLSEAGDVLVTVAARPRDCDRETGRVDIADEARRSRELLSRQALLVEMDRAEVASARPVLQDVERLLQKVAALESCARAGDIKAIHRELEEHRLLMKIDLMERELKG
jgi:hypothetical protein